MRNLTRANIVRVMYGLSTGAIALGIVQGFGGIAFSNVLTTFLTQLFSVLITLLLGGNLNEILLRNQLTT